MKNITFKEEICMGCGLCEVHCIVSHSTSKDVIKAYKNEKVRPASRIRLEIAKPISFPVQCQNCDDPPCVLSCLNGAMFKDKKGLVLNNPDKCVGCWTCIMVCPYGAVLKNPANSKSVIKCDLCPSLEIPACVANCPNEALIYEEIVPNA